MCISEETFYCYRNNINREMQKAERLHDQNLLEINKYNL